MPSFVFNDTATTDIYTLSLHDPLPISIRTQGGARPPAGHAAAGVVGARAAHQLSPLVEQLVVLRGGRRPAQGRRLDGAGRPTPARPGGLRAQTRRLDRIG